MTTSIRPQVAGTSAEHRLPQPGRHRSVAGRVRLFLIAPVVLVCALLAALVGPDLIDRLQDDSGHQYLGANGWPADGQAAYAIGSGQHQVGPGGRPAPIASLAKVMTALVVLRAAPLAEKGDGFRMTVSAADVAETQTRRERDESVVEVAEGEVLTERQALTALLLPSANNVAVMLARKQSGSVTAFVAKMNATARGLGMTDTHYTDPSGFEADTVSTAADQLVLATAAMKDPTFASIVALPRADLPVAGVVENTDFLLGTGGFVGIKTGSHDAAGGCFMFRAYRTIGGRSVVVTGVVLGQPGRRLVEAGQYAALQLVDRLTTA